MTREEEALLARLTDYAASECTLSERAEVEALIERSSEATVLFTQLQQTWIEIPSTQDVSRVQGVMQAVDMVLRNRSGASQPGASQRREPVSAMSRTRAASVTRWAWSGLALLIFGLGGYATTMVMRTTSPARQYASGIGQRRVLRFADGTRVTLAPQTSIRVDPGFDHDTRMIHVRGEAYFDVVNASGRPFVVEASGVTIRVLGTAFTIKKYPEDRDVVVAVQSGRVSVGRHTPVVLASNSMARIGDSTVMVTPDADLREYIEWVHGQLNVNRAPVSEVVATLGRWYGLQFQFADSSLARQHVTGAFSDHDDRSDVLQQLQQMLNVRMRFTGNIVTIVPAKASAIPRPSPRTRTSDMSQPEVGR